VAIAPVAVASGCGGREARSLHASPGHRLVIPGFDGIDPRLLSGWMEEGRLPRFRALAERGDHRPLADRGVPVPADMHGHPLLEAAHP
jgi:hypothetical protein